MSSLPEPTGERRGVLPERRDAGKPPAPVPPQRSVSVDEMLTQLRNPDGSKKKRRRRSEQLVYKQRRKRRLWIGILGGAAVLIVAGWYGVRFFQRLRLEGETFREGVNRRISTALDCQVDFTRIHDGGDNSLAAKEAVFTTRSGDLLETGALSDISAALTGSSWFSNEWGIRSLNIGKGTLKFNPNRSPSSGAAPVNTSVPDGEDGFRFSISPEPKVITLDGIRVTGGLDIEWPDPVTQGTESIQKLVGGNKFPISGGMEGAFMNGVMNLRGLPVLKLEQITWKLTGRKLEIPGARISSGMGARMEITGEADLVPGGAVALNINIVDTQLRTLFPTTWHERVSGSLSAKDCAFNAKFGPGPERTFSGDFTVNGALFNGMGFLSKLAYFLSRPEFASLEFPEMKGHFTWSPSRGLVLTNLSAERESKLRLAGDVSVTPAGEVRGKIKFSTTDLELSLRGQPVPHPFRPAEEGWSAMEFTVTGTAASVKDDIRVEGASLNFAQPPPPPGEDPAPAPAPAPSPNPAPAPRSNAPTPADP